MVLIGFDQYSHASPPSGLQIIPMENAHGREIVEGGNLCERKNGRGVDSNRNWPVHWGFRERDYDPNEEYPGTKPFRCLYQSHRKVWFSRD